MLELRAYFGAITTKSDASWSREKLIYLILEQWRSTCKIPPMGTSRQRWKDWRRGLGIGCVLLGREERAGARCRYLNSRQPARGKNSPVESMSAGLLNRLRSRDRTMTA